MSPVYYSESTIAKLNLEPPKKVKLGVVKTEAPRETTKTKSSRLSKAVPTTDPFDTPSALLLGSDVGKSVSSLAPSVSISIPAPAAMSRAAVPARAAPLAPSVTPEVLYTTIQSIFHEYWSMSFDSDDITAAFFARIDAYNAHMFRLSSFAPESTSLSVIQQRITERRYTSLDAFQYDMDTMFNNILKYYPPESPAVSTAQRLKAQFASQWQKTVERLR